MSLIISSGCTFTPPTFTPINTHQFPRADAAATPPSRLLARILELVPGNAEVSSPTPIVIAGNPDVMDMMDMMATTPPLTTPIPTLISLTAHADVFCVGEVCDQMWLRGPVEVVIEPDHFRASLQQISARSGDGSVHLTGRLTRYDYTNPLVDLSQSEMVLTAGDTIIT
ncbi:MAG: hypothetical protein J4F41_07935, partial [Alphaproteobacteria bacterium]|nr:hypothetical protein [Alphaproteobacteria bacterium]